MGFTRSYFKQKGRGPSVFLGVLLETLRLFSQKTFQNQGLSSNKNLFRLYTLFFLFVFRLSLQNLNTSTYIQKITQKKDET